MLKKFLFGNSLDGLVKSPPNIFRKVRFYAGAIFEEMVYKIVGHDKYIKWPKLASFFEKYH